MFVSGEGGRGDSVKQVLLIASIFTTLLCNGAGCVTDEKTGQGRDYTRYAVRAKAVDKPKNK